jgi:hypothetical protein
MQLVSSMQTSHFSRWGVGWERNFVWGLFFLFYFRVLFSTLSNKNRSRQLRKSSPIFSFFYIARHLSLLFSLCDAWSLSLLFVSSLKSLCRSFLVTYLKTIHPPEFSRNKNRPLRTPFSRDQPFVTSEQFAAGRIQDRRTSRCKPGTYKIERGCSQKVITSRKRADPSRFGGWWRLQEKGKANEFLPNPLSFRLHLPLLSH